MPITADITTITPEIARGWLALNTGNFRKVDPARVSCYARDMKADKWELNGETIKFNGEMLVDGQHRLLAVVRAGVPIKSIVVRGLESGAKNIDRGKPKTVAQWLAHEGISNASLAAAAARNCVAHEYGLWNSVSWGRGLFTDTDIIDFAKKYSSEMLESHSAARIRGVSSGALLAVLFIGSGKRCISSNSTATWFRDGLTTGSDLTERDAVLHLRNRLLAQSQGSANKLTPYMSRMLLTLAWNKTVMGAACTKGALRIRMTGPGAELPPERVLVAEQ